MAPSSVIVHLESSTKPTTESRDTTKALEAITLALAKSKRVVFGVGAGISTSAGIKDFRSNNGLYAGADDRPSTSRTKLKGPALFSASVYTTSQDTLTQHLSFIAKLKGEVDAIRNQSRSLRTDAGVTSTHDLMATLKKRKALRRVYSQNIDGFETTALQTVAMEGVCCSGKLLSEKGKGKAREWEGELVQLHGSLDFVRCSVCDWVGDWTTEHSQAFAQGKALDCPECEDRALARAVLQKRAIPNRSFVRPSIVLYDEASAAATSIGTVSLSDLKASPDFLLVMGTTLKIPGFKKLVKELSKAVRSRGGIAVFVNREEMPSKEWQSVFDYQVIGNSDTFSERMLGDWMRTRPNDWVVQKTLPESFGVGVSKVTELPAKPKKKDHGRPGPLKDVFFFSKPNRSTSTPEYQTHFASEPPPACSTKRARDGDATPSIPMPNPPRTPSRPSSPKRPRVASKSPATPSTGASMRFLEVVIETPRTSPRRG